MPKVIQMKNMYNNGSILLSFVGYTTIRVVLCVLWLLCHFVCISLAS
jgi:hypothetical protein